ncbi:MAG: hypothetical protein ABMA01_09290, partial [Chthoniobacteraceae bacterium]
QERARGIGGEVEFRGREGAGTRVALRVPLGPDRGEGAGLAIPDGARAPDEIGRADGASEELPQRVFVFDEARPRRR